MSTPSPAPIDRRFEAVFSVEVATEIAAVAEPGVAGERIFDPS